MNYQIISATKLSSSNLKVAEDIAAAQLRATGTPKLEIDSSLLAGVKIKVGTELLDLSLAGQIDRLTNSIN